jgi:uncharacterized surface protein with fasciclin (FAS1) repeats
MNRLSIMLATGTAALALAGCTTMNDGMATSTASTSTTASAKTSASMKTPMANPTVGGAAMLSSKTIVQNASMAPNLTTLVAAVKAAGLVDTLSGPGPFTVFAPTNDAFNLLAPGTVDKLLMPENKPSLVKVLTYHVVPGTITSADLMARIKAGGGTTTLTTVEGEPITATMEGNVIKLTSATGNVSFIQTADVRQSNGMVHVVNGVLIPNLG